MPATVQLPEQQVEKLRVQSCVAEARNPYVWCNPEDCDSQQTAC